MNKFEVKLIGKKYKYLCDMFRHFFCPLKPNMLRLPPTPEPAGFPEKFTIVLNDDLGPMMIDFL